LQEGSADAVARLPVPRAYARGVIPPFARWFPKMNTIICLIIKQQKKKLIEVIKK
jgi:hypothetical protein